MKEEEKMGDPEVERIKRSLEEVEEEIAEGGGVYCAWSNADHADFLRLRSKHKGRLSLAFVNDVRSMVPGETEESIRAHYEAYEKYLELT